MQCKKENIPDFSQHCVAWTKMIKFILYSNPNSKKYRAYKEIKLAYKYILDLNAIYDQLKSCPLIEYNSR